MTEVYKIVNGIALLIMNSLFNFCANIHNIRNFQEIFTENRKTVKYGIETVAYRSPFLLAIIQSEYKNAKSLEEFKSKITTWKCDFCPCRFCKNYTQNFFKNQLLLIYADFIMKICKIWKKEKYFFSNSALLHKRFMSKVPMLDGQNMCRGWGSHWEHWKQRCWCFSGVLNVNPDPTLFMSHADYSDFRYQFYNI